MLKCQGGLGAPGYAPVASCDTTAADMHRCAAVRERWGPRGEGPPPAQHVLHAVPPETPAERRRAQAIRGPAPTKR